MKINNKIIIAGFPGIGKSCSANVLKNISMDCDSSGWHWISKNDNNGNTEKIINPIWPENYIDFIKMIAFESDGLEDYKDLKYICCSTHEEVLSYMRRHHIPFIIVVPEDKQDTIKRYKERGNSEEFISKLDENWDNWMDNFKSYDMPIIKLKAGVYLSDILSKRGSFRYLMDKIKNVEKYILSTEEDPYDDPLAVIVNGLCDHMDKKDKEKENKNA